MTILHELTSDYDRADALVHILIDKATGGPAAECDFGELRLYFTNNSELSERLPPWFASKRSLNQFWHFIQSRFSTYAERRAFLWGEFEPLLRYCEVGSGIPAEDDIDEALRILDSRNVERVWKKILFRLPEDRDGAITVARSLFESVCKHILDDRKVAYDESADLPALYRRVANELNLAPEQHSEQVYKQILGGCASVVTGLASLRNKLGDAHGPARAGVNPAPRHARLAVNLGGAMALYLLETHSANTK